MPSPRPLLGPGTWPKCLTFFPLLVSPLMTLTLHPEENDGWHLTTLSLLRLGYRSILYFSNTVKYTDSSLPHWNCIIMPCVAGYASSRCTMGSQYQATFPQPALNSSWYLGLILLCSVCHLVCCSPPSAKFARILCSQWPRFHASFSAMTSDKWRDIERSKIYKTSCLWLLDLTFGIVMDKYI